MNEELKWYQKTWGIILLLMLFFPVGLYFLWKSDRDTDSKIKIIFIYVLCVIIGLIFNESNREVSKINQSKSVVQQESRIEKADINTYNDIKEESAQKIEIPVPKTQSIPQPTKITDLGINYLTFNERYNNKAINLDDNLIWSVGDATTKTGNQTVFTYKFTPRIIMQGAMFPNNEMLKEVWILSNVKGNYETHLLINAYIAMVTALNPGMNDSQIVSLFSELKLDDMQELQDGGEAFRGRVRYKTQIIPGTGLMFLASAKDL